MRVGLARGLLCREEQVVVERAVDQLVRVIGSSFTITTRFLDATSFPIVLPSSLPPGTNRGHLAARFPPGIILIVLPRGRLETVLISSFNMTFFKTSRL